MDKGFEITYEDSDGNPQMPMGLLHNELEAKEIAEELAMEGYINIKINDIRI